MREALELPQVPCCLLVAFDAVLAAHVVAAAAGLSYLVGSLVFATAALLLPPASAGIGLLSHAAVNQVRRIS